MNIIPAIDLRGGRTVRLLHGDYDAETQYEAEPVALAQRYGALGLRQLHLVDLDGARSGEPSNRALITQISRATSASVQVGGGIRTQDHIDALFAVPVARVVIGSLAVTDPSLVCDWITHYGPERVVLALDVRVDHETEGARLAIHGWTQTTEATIDDLMTHYRPAGLRHVLCTDIGRDGALEGPAVELYATLVQRYPDIAWQASGGVSGVSDLERLRDTGVAGAITGRALLDGHISDEEIQSF